jgi:hypothetical protein
MKMNGAFSGVDFSLVCGPVPVLSPSEAGLAPGYQKLQCDRAHSEQGGRTTRARELAAHAAFRPQRCSSCRRIGASTAAHTDRWGAAPLDVVQRATNHHTGRHRVVRWSCQQPGATCCWSCSWARPACSSSCRPGARSGPCRQPSPASARAQSLRQLTPPGPRRGSSPTRRAQTPSALRCCPTQTQSGASAASGQRDGRRCRACCQAWVSPGALAPRWAARQPGAAACCAGPGRLLVPCWPEPLRSALQHGQARAPAALSLSPEGAARLSGARPPAAAGIAASFYNPSQPGAETLAVYAKPTGAADTGALGSAQVGPGDKVARRGSCAAARRRAPFCLLQQQPRAALAGGLQRCPARSCLPRRAPGRWRLVAGGGLVAGRWRAAGQLQTRRCSARMWVGRPLILVAAGSGGGRGSPAARGLAWFWPGLAWPGLAWPGLASSNDPPSAAAAAAAAQSLRWTRPVLLQLRQLRLRLRA